MIEFGTKRSGNGKKSRIHKKFPRKRIAKIGEKAAGWCRNNWDDDKYPYFNGNLRRFLLSNVGRPVDKVFSEFLNRCRKSASRYNLKHEFYEMFEEKEDISYWGGFYLTNGIINYKKKRKSPYRQFPASISDLNRKLIPENLNEICRRCEETHQKQYLGEFWVDYKTCKRVYIIERKVYEEDWFHDSRINKLVQHYDRCYLYGIGSGINRYTWASQSRLCPRVTYEVSDGWDVKSDKSDLIFITKIIR
mgnify:CR=1 FL=1